MSRHLDTQRIEGFDSLTVQARTEALAHVRECAACRAAWIAAEPTRVFALLSETPIPAERLERLSESVAAEIRPRPRRWYGAASVAASLLLAAVLGAVLWNHEVPAESIARIDQIGFLEPLPLDSEGTRLVALPGDDASVLDLNIGETQVLLIFDESIEL